jgi:hypothetical protein
MACIVEQKMSGACIAFEKRFACARDESRCASSCQLRRDDAMMQVGEGRTCFVISACSFEGNVAN